MFELIGFSHAYIAIFYFALAVVLVVGIWYFRPFSPKGNILVAFGLTLFFLGCAGHHIDFLVHGLLHEPIDLLAFHHWIASLMQVVGSTISALVIVPYVLDAIDHKSGDRPIPLRHRRRRDDG